MRWTRLSRYSGVISSADSRRMPRSIFAIISRSSLMAGASWFSGYRVRSGLFDHAHGLALGARQRPRGHQREGHAEADGLRQPGGHALLKLSEDWMRGVEAGAARDHGRRRLHLHLEPRERARAVDDELVVRDDLVDAEQRRLHLGRIEVHALDDEHVVGAAFHTRD